MAIIKVFSNNIEVRTNKLYLKRPKWIARQSPTFRMRDRSDLLGGGKQSLIMSVPSFNDMISHHESLDNTYWQKLSVKLKEPSNREHIKKFVNACYKSFRPSQASNIRIYNYYDQ